MRYIVKVEGLSAEVLENLKKNSRIIHIFSLIDNMIALETEDVGRIKELRGVKRVYEPGKAKLMLHDALNIIGIFSTAEDKGFSRWIQGHRLIRTDKAAKIRGIEGVIDVRESSKGVIAA